jgi:hypothetical protein
MKRISVAWCLGSLVALGVGSFPGAACAESPESGALRRELHTYYEGEKSGAFQFALPGLVNVGVGTALLASNTSDVGKGAAVPSVAFGAIEVVVGAVLFLRTDSLLARLDRKLALDPRGFHEEERAHLRRVDTQFSGLMAVEIAVTGLGAGLAAGGAFAKDPTVQGVGVGLAVQSTVLFLLDATAAERSSRYLGALESFSLQKTSNSGWTLGYATRF